MTGFARAEGESEGLLWAWEFKSVNSKALDLRFRLPPGFDSLEIQVRTLVNERLKRGAVGASLSVTRTAGATGLRVNRTALAEVLALARELSKSGEIAPPSIDGLLALRGIIESGDDVFDTQTRDRQAAAVVAGCRDALDSLALMRCAEGKRLAEVLLARLDEIESLTAEAARSAAAQPEAIRTRLTNQIAALKDLVPSIADERLAQEAALIVARGDVCEELDRLNAHIAAARDMVAEGGPIGRRLDFLCQEFNREANTLCSKSADMELTRLGLALKAAVEQFREQVQNIE